MAKNIKIYSTPSCPYCKMAKQFLKDNNIDFLDIDISNNRQEASKMVEISGQMGVPVLDIDGTIIIGFNKPEIMKALGF